MRKILLSIVCIAISFGVAFAGTPPASSPPPPASQAEAEAGTGTVLRSWTPQRLAQAIAAQAGEGAVEVSDVAFGAGWDNDTTHAGSKNALYDVVNPLVTAVGIAVGAGNLGTFTGTTIPDSKTVKEGLQALETAVEGKAASDHDHSGVYQPADADIPTVSASQAEMETGTEEALRAMSPLRVAQAIAALSSSATGDVTKVGDCAGGDCLDGSSDGGTYIRLYDGNSHYTQIAAGDSTGNLTFTLPTAAPGGNNAIVVMSTGGAMSTVASTTYQAADTELGQIAGITGVHGSILYYNESAWVALAAGISGQYLQTQGPDANPQWASTAVSGDVESIGDCTSGACFNGGSGNTLYFEGATANDFEIALTGADPTADVTVTIPATTGTIVLGPASFAADNILVKTDYAAGKPTLTQATGITVDDSNNVSGIGTLAVTSISPTTFVAIGADPADAGAIRLSNNTGIYAENSTPGTDIQVIGTDTGNIVQIASSGSSGVTITPATTITGALTLSGSILTGNRAFIIGDATTDSITFTTDGTGNAEIVLPDDSIGDAEIDWGSGAGQVDLDDVPDGTNYQKVAAADVDASGHVNILYDSDATGAVQFTGMSTTRAITVDDAAQTLAARNRDNTFTGSNTFGDGDTDVVTLRGIVKGGDRTGTNDGVQIASTLATATYATAVDSLYVTGPIETPNIIYSAGLNTGNGTEGSREITMVTNTGANVPAAVGNKLYFIDNVFKVVENGTAKDVPLPSDSVTWTGSYHDFTGTSGLRLPTSQPDVNGEIAINNTSEQLQMYVNSGLKTFDFSSDSSGYVLKSDGSGNFTLQADATGGSPTLNSVANPTGDTTIAMDAGEEVNFDYTGNFTTGSQFKIEQKTGNPSGGVVFEVKVADTDVTAARIGDGTNYAQFGQDGSVTLAGTAIITAGGIVLGDTTPDSNGEIGYASNHYNFYANSEDMVWTAGTDTWTFSSNTGAHLVLGGANLTSPTITTAITPAAAGASTIGTTALEWGNLYLTDSAVIYGEASQANSMTSSATGWTFNQPATFGQQTTTAGSIYFQEGSGGGTDLTRLQGAAATTGAITVTLPAVTSTLATLGANVLTGAQTFTGSGGLTSPPITTAINPVSDGGATLGTKNTAEWQNLYLNTGGTIEFENGDVTLTHSANTLTLAGGTLALGANSLTMSGPISDNTNRVSKGWFTNVESTNAPTVNGVAGNATNGLVTNPMSAAGDMIYGGTSGVTTRLAVAGQPGYMLTSGTTAGGTTPLWLAPGAAGTILAGAGTTTTPTWSASPTISGDLIISGGDITLGSATGPVKGSATFYGATSGTAVVSAADVAGSAVAVRIPAVAGTIAVATPSATATQALFATTTSGAPEYRAIAAGDLPATLSSGTAITNAALTTPVIGAATGTSLTLTGVVTGLMPAINVTKPSGTSTDVPSETVLTHADDGSAANAYVGMTLYNVTDGVSGTVTASDSTTITVAAGSMSWANTNVYQLGPGPTQSGSMFYVGTAGTIRHPATAGYAAGYYVNVAGVVTVDMASDSMIFQGVLNSAFATLDAGDCIDSPATKGSFYVIHNKSATEAIGFGFANVWLDGGAS
jgi:hypothetical protein